MTEGNTKVSPRTEAGLGWSSELGKDPPGLHRDRLGKGHLDLRPHHSRAHYYK